MSNSQNKKNEQQNNLCTTLTEQWKKGELKSGWYFVKVGKYEAEIDLYDDDHSQWLNSCDKDIYPVKVLAPVPSYEEWQHQQMSLRMTIDDYKNVVDICEQLKELLERASYCIIGYRHNDHLPERVFYEEEVSNLLEEIDEVLK